MHRLKFSLETLSPVVLSSASNSTVMTETHSAFGGSIIRGILATRFVQVKRLTDEAHDKTFREIFFCGVRFLPANPVVSGERSFVLPLSLQSGKAGTDDADKVQDLLADTKSRPGYKNFRGLGVLSGKQFVKADVRTNIFMHISRSGDDERLKGRSVGGQVYNYEAIDADQKFCGEIIGDEKILRQLRDGLNLDCGKMIAYVGRSRFTQYGKCLLTFGDAKELDAQEEISGTVYLRLETPLIPQDDCFLRAREVLSAAVGGKIGAVFAAGVEIENFVVPWGMKRPRVMALAAGTVFAVDVSQLTAADRKILAEKIYAGIGLRTEEGFGQLRIWEPSTTFTKGKLPDVSPIRPKNFSADTIAVAKKILKSRLLEQTRLYAHEDADKLRPQLQRGNMTHFFTRLDVIFANAGKKNLRAKFREQLDELRPGSLFKEHLEKFRMANGQLFSDVFTGQANFPRKVGDAFRDTKISEVRGVIDFTEKDFTDDEFLAEYLTNYFRFARKLAAASKGGDDRE